MPRVDGRCAAAVGTNPEEARTTMSKSGILDALRQEEQSLRTQLVAIQRAIEAIAEADGPAGPVGRRSKQARKVVARPKRVLTPPEQRQAIGERMRKYWAARREANAPE